MVYVDKVDTLFIKNASQGLCQQTASILKKVRPQSTSSRELQYATKYVGVCMLTDAWQVQGSSDPRQKQLLLEGATRECWPMG